MAHLFIRMGLVLLAIAGGFLISASASAHPGDEFCTPGSGMDRELCRQLAALDDANGDVSTPLIDAEGNALSGIEAAGHFLQIGVWHILPGGTDHILFVLALFLAATNLRSLVLQISVFTLAHTATLGLTAAGVIDPPARVVEPLIALSIAYVAVENLFLKDISRWRYAVIFGFGLFHGMGFAGFIREIGLPSSQFWPSLIGFNIGVELGQLFVVAVAFAASLALKPLLARQGVAYRQVVIVPMSVLIAVIGSLWFISRSLGL